MRRWLRSERGELNLVGLVVAAGMSLVVSASSLSLYDSFAGHAAKELRRNDAQDTARRAADALARDLRNLAGPTQDQPEAVDLAGPFDLVFKTVDPVGPNTGTNASNVLRRRFCLGGTPGAEVLWTQTQRWTSEAAPPVPSTAACPGTGWDESGRLTDRVSNRRAGLARPVFTYEADGTTISGVHVDLFIDDDLTRLPAETRLGTGVFLRNQNRAPQAAFTATRTAQGIVLNGSASVDPEGEPLRFTWIDGGTPIASCSGITCTHRVPSGSVRELQLRVEDPAGLAGVTPVQAVTG